MGFFFVFYHIVKKYHPNLLENIQSSLKQDQNKGHSNIAKYSLVQHPVDGVHMALGYEGAKASWLGERTAGKHGREQVGNAGHSSQRKREQERGNFLSGDFNQRFLQTNRLTSQDFARF